MIRDDLFEEWRLGFEEFAQTPAPEDIVPESHDLERTIGEFESKLESDPETIVLSHTDADGYSAAALVEELAGSDSIVQTIDYQEAFGIHDALYSISHHNVRDSYVYIVDLAPGESRLEGGVERVAQGLENTVWWYDHHQWSDEARERIESAGANVVIDDEECAASLLERELPYEYPEHLRELAEVTKDIDLWIKNDPRSERLNALASAVGYDRYSEIVTEYGAEWPDAVDETIDDYLETQREFEEVALENVTQYEVGGYTVAVTYVSDGRSSEIGNELVESEDRQNDIALVLKPTEVGVYSHSNRETFARCHEIAGEMNGGGHPTAAGSGVPAWSFRELAEYWATCGESLHEELVETVEEVVNDG